MLVERSSSRRCEITFSITCRIWRSYELALYLCKRERERKEAEEKMHSDAAGPFSQFSLSLMVYKYKLLYRETMEESKKRSSQKSPKRDERERERERERKPPSENAVERVSLGDKLKPD